MSSISKTEDRAEWTVDEWLSKTKRDTKITPIITVVFYTGEDPWDGPISLHDMMNLDDEIKPFVPDYPLYVIDIGHDKDLSFKNKELCELKDILSSIYSETADNNEAVVDNSIIALAGILAGDKMLYLSAQKEIGGNQKVCRVLEERDKILLKTVKEEFAAERDMLVAERDKFIAECAEKDALIEQLYKQLAKQNVQ